MEAWPCALPPNKTRTTTFFGHSDSMLGDGRLQNTATEISGNVSVAGQHFFRLRADGLLAFECCSSAGLRPTDTESCSLLRTTLGFLLAREHC